MQQLRVRERWCAALASFPWWSDAIKGRSEHSRGKYHPGWGRKEGAWVMRRRRRKQGGWNEMGALQHHTKSIFFFLKSSLGRLRKVSHQTKTTILCFLGARQLHYSEIIVISSRFCTAHKLLYPLLCKLRPGNWGKCFHRIQYIMRIKVSSRRAENGPRLQQKKETSPEWTHSQA